MAKPTIDDEIAKKWCKTFIKDLDPQKIYFLKADVDEFLPQATNLDDLVKKGNIDFAKDVFKRFLKRSDERLAMVQDIVKQKPDFTIDESMSDDAEKMDYPVNDDEPASGCGSGSSSNCSRPRLTATRKTAKKKTPSRSC